MVKAVYHGTANEDNDDLPDGVTFRALHAAAGVPIHCEMAVRLMIELYPEQLGQLDKANGWAPLQRSRSQHKCSGSGQNTCRKVPCRRPDSRQERQASTPPCPRSWTLGIQPLVLAAPMTVRIANSTRGLYPFQEAAFLGSTFGDLDTVFGLLLRADPAVLRCA
eukprot:scaffold70387_cov52-Attheya_sp.AAC.1